MGEESLCASIVGRITEVTRFWKTGMIGSFVSDWRNSKSACISIYALDIETRQLKNTTDKQSHRTADVLVRCSR